MPDYSKTERNAAILPLLKQGKTAPEVVEALRGRYPALTVGAVRGVKKRLARAGEDIPRGAGGRPSSGKAKPRKRKAPARKAPAKGKQRTPAPPAGAGKERLTLRLPPDVARDVRLYAAARRMGLGDVVEEALRALFKRKPPVP